ncbi:MAG: hypothetical protein HGA36_04670 [Candidatus Moranbacteria bacterium]|nr:hypothetical protein [Candidatus Moranbacteria bacterium]
MFRNNRQSTGFMRIRPDKYNFVGLGVNDPSKRETELWMILEQYSEIKEVRKKFIKNLGIKNSNKAEKVSKNFQSFVRQAKNYYFAAKKLPNSSSALLYYYSFLNLIKALLILHYSDKISGKISHGLQAKDKRGNNFKDEHVLFRDGVFKLLYEHETGEKIKDKTSFSISTLLGYCNDISYQYSIGGFGESLNARGLMILFIDKNRNKAWGTLALYNFESIEKCKKRVAKFKENYEEISMDKSVARECFNLMGAEMHSFRFFEGKEYTVALPDGTSEFQIINEIKECTKGFLIPNLYDDKNIDFNLASPYKQSNQILMNEFLSIYAVMFYLSSLVRYQPYYLDKILDKKESWLINSFIESCPQTFLLYAVSKITRQNYSLTQR